MDLRHRHAADHYDLPKSYRKRNPENSKPKLLIGGAMNTFTSFETLRRPLPRYSVKNLYYASARLIIKTVGNLSGGIRLGNRFGFESGVIRDYFYNNQAQGKFLTVI